MRTLRTAGLLSLLLLTWGCTLDRHSRGGSAEEADLPKVLAGFMDALNTCDLERTMAFFAPDATMFFPSLENALRAETKDAIAAVFADYYGQARSERPEGPCSSLVPQDVRIQRFGDGAVISFQIAKGPVTSRRSMTLRHQDGEWRIIHFHASNLRKDPEE